MDLKIGDVVQLKSGGPLMTIQDIATYTGQLKATCVWFDGNKKARDLFRLESLVIVDE